MPDPDYIDLYTRECEGWKARAEKAEAQLAELLEAAKPFVEKAQYVIGSRASDNDFDSWQLKRGDLRRLAEVAGRIKP
ncbi:MAG TPA: hypothetical protein VKQ11_00650 [Candidatus Sulfotelmatobacter sp.]|nr:hypothetical protein [Candidatus Sulfotelmatobacter sp.]